MQFPESWLREFCDPPLSSQALADLLTMSGLEVESLQSAAPAFAGVVVAEIVEAEPHPSADRLRVCRVDAGVHSRDGLLQVVCGAPNARAGLRAPLALVGAQLPCGDDGKPFEIKKGVLRGVESARTVAVTNAPLAASRTEPRRMPEGRALILRSTRVFALTATMRGGAEALV